MFGLTELAGGGIGAFLGVAFNNVNQIPKNRQNMVVGAATVAGFTIAEIFVYYAERRAQTRQRFNEEFVRQHPELFPERKVYKYKDKFLPWSAGR